MTNHNKIIVGLLIIYLFSSCAFSQQLNNVHLKTDINDYKATLEEKMIEAIKASPEIPYNDSIKVIAFPAIKLSKDFLKDTNSVQVFIIDSLSNCFILSQGNKKRYITNFYFPKPRFHFNLKNYATWVNMINEAEKKSKNVFFFNFFTSDLKEKMPVVAYFINDRMEFIDDNLDTFKSLQKLINYRYGSLEAYKNELDYKKFYSSYLNKINNLNDAKLYYRNNPKNYLEQKIYAPEALANAIIFQVEEFCTLTVYQKKELKKKLLLLVKNEGFGKNNNYKALLYSATRAVLKEVLMNEQFSKYWNNYILFHRVTNQATGLINKYFKDEYLSNDTTDIAESELKRKFLLEEVFYSDTIKAK